MIHMKRNILLFFVFLILASSPSFASNDAGCTISRLHAKLEEESPMPYLFDIVDYTHLNHVELREHIDRVGKFIFKREHEGPV